MLKKIKKVFLKYPSQQASNKPAKPITLNINGLLLTIDPSDFGATAYESKGSYEELANPIYKEIKKISNPLLVIDIGSNYGFTGLVFAQNFPDAKFLLVEADARLCQFIKQNFKQNGFSNFKVINAICGEKDGVNNDFSLNPTSSQDNRVVGESNKWVKKSVTSVSLSNLIGSNLIESSIFIKIDTQGYEEHVFKGGHNFLTKNNNWIIKTEFAPYWLNSQGTNPVNLLNYITSTFHVVELPARSSFLSNSISDILKYKLLPSNSENFINYITSLNKENRGWCDLLIIPKKHQLISKL
ncbi:MAG: FkbM family methyltransferase [Thermodesulfobacteriota bacterium]